MLAQSRVPNQLDIAVVYIAFYVESFHQLAALFYELLVIVIGEESLEEIGLVYPLLY